MITFSVNQQKINELKRLLKGNSKKLRRQLTTAVNATSRKTRSQMAKGVGKELAVTQKAIKQTIDIKKKATNASRNPTAIVSQKYGERLPLRDFKSRQTKAGVTYKISKTGGRKTAIGAFQGPRPGQRNARWNGRAFKRVGKSRLPITQLFGASPWGVFEKQKLRKPTVKESRKELLKQIDRRIRYLKLKQSGAI